MYHICMKPSVNILPITSDNLEFVTCLKVEFWDIYICKGEGVRPLAKRSPLFSIKYLTTHWSPPLIIDRITDKSQYPISNCFTEDKYLNCFFRAKWRVKNSILDYTFIICLSIKYKTSLININILMFRIGEISFLKLLSQNVSQLSVKCKLNYIR